MKRNAVKSGLFDQRGRATTRRRSRRRQGPVDRGDGGLTEWLVARGPRSVRRVDLEKFLRDTAGFEPPAAERLRQLAIYLELEAQALPGAAGWDALRRIYDRALRLEPENAEVYVSMSISAREQAECLADSPEQRRILDAGVAAARQAIELAPDSASAHDALGHLLYSRGETQAALEAFECALACDADGPRSDWVRLYRAHCLHDMERWADALAAYDAVGRASFTGPCAWRVDVLAEQKALCLHRLGRVAEARERLLAILDRYQREPHLGFWAMSVSLWRLAEESSPEILERAKAIHESAGLTPWPGAAAPEPAAS